MIRVRICAASASFRKSFARSYAETYPIAPPATVYGMLLSLVGERFRAAHEGARLAFAYKVLPRVTRTLHKLSRYKYGVPGKQAKLGNQPDWVETACGLDFTCWVDSSSDAGAPTLEDRIAGCLDGSTPVTRYGVLSLGRSDDMVDEISLLRGESGQESYYRLRPSDDGALELPVWVDHVGSHATIWRRFEIDREPVRIDGYPGLDDFVEIRSLR